MTTQPWSSMPGWGIAADLTPPELLNTRNLRRLRALIGAGLVALLVAGLAGYLLAARQRHDAAGALDAAQARTSRLQASVRSYSRVTRIQGTVSQVQAQLAGLTGSDVDVSALLARLRASLPSTMTIQNESVTISQAGVANPGGNPGLDTSGRAHIGTVLLTGTARSLDDLAGYVDRLSALDGVADVIPTSNVAGQAGVQYTVALGLTDALLVHPSAQGGSR